MLPKAFNALLPIPEESSGNSYHLKTEDKVAEEQKVSPKTVRNAADFASAVDARFL